MRSFFLAVTGLVSLLVAAVLLIPSAAGHAAPSGGSATTEQHWSIASNEVLAQDDACTMNTAFAVGGVTGTATCRNFVASVHLPDGADVTKMQVFYDDSVDPANAIFILAHSDVAMDIGDGSSDHQITTSGAPGKTDSTSNGHLVIDNSLNHYAFEMALAGGLTFYGAVLTYTAPSSGAANANGDVDCDGDLTTRDNQALLRHVLGQPPLSQTQPCPEVGA